MYPKDWVGNTGDPQISDKTSRVMASTMRNTKVYINLRTPSGICTELAPIDLAESSYGEEQSSKAAWTASTFQG